ncbi:MAG: glycosyltransferase, partial [Clostridiales bacterium]|nr:glycosyltransferase [Clostridiales bacterium]
MIKLVHAISDSNIGGAGRYLLTYLANCDRDRFSVSVLLPAGSRLTAEIEALGFRTFPIEGLAEASASFRAVPAITAVLRREQPDLVHTHAALSARVAARIAGVKKIVYTRHSVFPQKPYLTRGAGKWLNGVAA